MRILIVALALACVAATFPQVKPAEPIVASFRSPTKVACTAGSVYAVDPRLNGLVRVDDRAPISVTSLDMFVDSVASHGTNVYLLSGSRVLELRDSEIVALFDTGIAHGTSLAAGDFGFAVGSSDGFIRTYTRDGQKITQFGGRGEALGQLQMPAAIAYDRERSRLIVVDSVGRKIVVFELTGTHVSSNDAGPGDFYGSPSGIALEYEGSKLHRIYVVDTRFAHLRVLDRDLRPVHDFSKQMATNYFSKNGTGKHDLLVPTDVCYDEPNRRLVVANGMGNLAVFEVADGRTSQVARTIERSDFRPEATQVRVEPMESSETPPSRSREEMSVELSRTLLIKNELLGDVVLYLNSPDEVSTLEVFDFLSSHGSATLPKPQVRLEYTEISNPIDISDNDSNRGRP